MESIRRLLAAGALVDQKDKGGKRAMSYAVGSGRPDVERLLREAGARTEKETPGAPAPVDIRTAVTRSLPLLERTSKDWMESRGCNACHLQPMMLRVNAVARSQGFPADRAMLDLLDQSMREDLGPHFAREAEKALRSEEGVAVASLHVGGDQAYALAMSFSSALDAGLPRQSYDKTRVPMQSGRIASTAMAARVLKGYAAEIRADDFASRVAQARAWLEASLPRTTDDAAFRLLGLRWLDADRATIARAAATLQRRQLSGGGWSQVDGLNPDAYATGLALVALREGGGLSGSDPVYRRGVDHLLATQHPDGSWMVPKRSVPVNRYYESGFPHGKFQYSSFLGTAWATMALMYGQPEKRS